MAHRTQLNTEIARLTGISKHTIDRIGVNLNRGGLIHSGGRGRHAPDMGPEDLKTILMAILGSEHTSKVFKTVLNLHMYQTDDKQEFGEVFLAICSDPEMASQVMQISILRNYPLATIYWKDASGTRIGKIENFKGVSDDEQPGLRILATISGAAISELVQLVSD